MSSFLPVCECTNESMSQKKDCLNVCFQKEQNHIMQLTYCNAQACEKKAALVTDTMSEQKKTDFFKHPGASDDEECSKDGSASNNN